jgi:phosphatidylserine decarboxylase
VVEPDDDDVIANACESKPYYCTSNAKLQDRFSVKGQSYSLADMLGNDPLAEQFVGGTIYQASLGILSYHRWHAPVSGIIKKAHLIEGTYYFEPPSTGIRGAEDETNPELGMAGQGYLTHTATRAAIFIEADNPKIGLMTFLAVGMCEVSTCDIQVKEGQHVTKGDEIGSFHFGGSTHCVIFRGDVNIKGLSEQRSRLGGDHNIPVCSKLAVVE